MLCMDPLTHYLAGPRATRAFALMMHMGGRWGISIRDESALTVIAVVAGTTCVDGTLLYPGDVALVRGPDPYLLTDADQSPANIVIDPGQHCRTLDGHDLRQEYRRGIRRWGNAEQGDTTVLVGTYERPDDVGGLVVSSLPRLAVVRREHAESSIVDVLAQEISHDGPAGQIVVDRLLDVLVVSTVRAWSATAAGQDHRTWLACSDPVVVHALELIHAEPGASWTVERLARQVNVSRASFAARFRAGVGQAPMAYLTRWRLTLAGDLLLTPTNTVAAVARTVGYDNPYAFSTAFKRHTGVTPSDYRHGKELAAVS